MKSRIVFLGSRDLGYKALKSLIEDDRFMIVGVGVGPDSEYRNSENDLNSLIKKYKLNIINESDLDNTDFEVGISVNYHKIIKKSVLDLASRGFWNIHHSYNLRLRGRNITTHAILNSKKDQIYYHGTSLHQMVPELDSGPIVASRSVKIESDDTAYTLFTKVDKIALELFKEWIPRIAFEKVYPYDAPNEGVRMFRAKDLPSKEIPRNLTDDEIYDYVRAFDFPGHEPAFMYADGEKVELVVNERENYRKKRIIANKTMFTRSKLQ